MEFKNCPTCGREVLATYGWKFCVGCGTKLPSTPISFKVAELLVEAEDQGLAVPEVKSKKDCGEKSHLSTATFLKERGMENDWKHCPFCGSELPKV